MRFPILQERAKPGISGKAIADTLHYFEVCGGKVPALLAVLADHSMLGSPALSRELFLDGGSAFSPEFFFYLTSFAKELVGRDDFHFGEGSDELLSEHRRIYERGPARNWPWYESPPERETQGFDLLNFSIPLAFLRERGEDPAELLGWFFAFLPDEARRDDDFFQSTTVHCSSEACLLFHSLFEAFVNDLGHLEMAFYRHYSSPEHCPWSFLFFEGKGKDISELLEMRRRTIASMEDSVTMHGRSVEWSILIKDEDLSAQYAPYVKGGTIVGMHSNAGAIRSMLEAFFTTPFAYEGTRLAWGENGRYGGVFLFKRTLSLTGGQGIIAALAAVGAVSVALCDLIGGRTNLPRILGDLALFVAAGIGACFIAGAIGRRGVTVQRQKEYLRCFFRKMRSLEGALTQGRAARIEELAREHGLSDREREIVAYVIQGCTDKEIGFALSLSPRTVGNRVLSTYRKLGIHSRQELFVLVYPEGRD